MSFNYLLISGAAKLAAFLKTEVDMFQLSFDFWKRLDPGILILFYSGFNYLLISGIREYAVKYTGGNISFQLSFDFWMVSATLRTCLGLELYVSTIF